MHPSIPIQSRYPTSGRLTQTLVAMVIAAIVGSAGCGRIAASSPAPSGNTLYVWQGSPSPAAPFDTWTAAAHTIQDAVDAAMDGDTVWVTNGVYATGGRAINGNFTNRVAVDKAITLLSVNGPEVTVIAGQAAPGGGNGEGAVRCVYLGTNAILSGFTLTNGHTGSNDGDAEPYGGGARCAMSAVVTNCVITGNSSKDSGGGVLLGTLYNCILERNSAAGYGGGASGSTLYGCTLTGNSARYGGGASGSTLYNCILEGNSAGWSGGGGFESTLYNCVLTGNRASTGGGGGASISSLYNCTVTGNQASFGGGVYGYFDPFDDGYPSYVFNSIVYSNSAEHGPNYYDGSQYFWPYAQSVFFTKSCTTPLPPGEGNIDLDPQLASTTHISSSSPCVAAGSALYSFGLDIDSEPWLDPPSMGADQVHSTVAGSLSVRIEATHNVVSVDIPVELTAIIEGPVTASKWEMGDGITLTNQPYASHHWTIPGLYTVRLNAFNDDHPQGVSASAQVEVIEPLVHYVAPSSDNPVFPYDSWATAATTIQEAVEAATVPGSLVLVTNGIYDTGASVVSSNLTNRVTVKNRITVSSVNGPHFTLIKGMAGDDGIGCVYLSTNSVLSGFTLSNGQSGVRCEGPVVVTNCIVTGNAGGGVHGGTLYDCIVSSNSGSGAVAATLYRCTLTNNVGIDGGGASRCVLFNCVISDNLAEWEGGGTYGGILYNCVLTGNEAKDGGGAYAGTFYNCTIVGNSALWGGGGVFGYDSGPEFIPLAFSGTLYNCIVYFNTASYGPNHIYASLQNSCTTPVPRYARGTIDTDPGFVDLANGDLRLARDSPCIDSGTDLSSPIVVFTSNLHEPGGAFEWTPAGSVWSEPVTNDLNDLPRALDGDGDGVAAFDMGAWEFDARSVVPEEWLVRHQLDPADPYVLMGNSDQDPLTNFQEWLADTDPTDGQSYFKIESFTIAAIARVEFRSSSNRLYTLQADSDVAGTNWAGISGQINIPGDGGLMSLSEGVPAWKRFYRVVVTVP